MRFPRRLGSEERVELVDHLDELRRRILIALIAFGVGSAIAFAFHGDLLGWLNHALPEGRRRPVTLSVAEPFTTSLKVSLYAGFALALPVVLWQVWSFLAPAVHQHTRRVVAGFVAFASALFAGGVAFSYAFALPAALHFLTNYDSALYDIEVRAKDYYSFALMVLLSVGLVFQLPIFLLGLVKLGVTSSTRLRRNRRLGYVAMAALAVALPGVDPVTTALEMAPLVLLFEASIWLAVLFERRWKSSLYPRPASAPLP
jgi:sec-independent protein translocase protein TatC